MLGPADRDKDTTARVVLSHGFWTRRYGGDPAVVGTTVRIGKAVFAIVGVTQPGFIGPDLEALDVWLPIAVTGAWFGPEWRTNRGVSSHLILARVPHGMPAVGAGRAWLAGPRVASRHVVSRRRPLPRRDDFPGTIRGNTGIPAPLLVAAVGTFIFLVACANAATLFYVRGMRT